MNIREFAYTHDQQPGTVATYIKRHKNLFNDHIEKVGNNTELDDEAIRLLELQYPLPKPIQVVENTETQQKYINSLEQINYLQNQLLQFKEQLQEFKSLKLLLEEKNNEYKIAKDKIESLNEEIICMVAKEERHLMHIKELNSKYEKLKNRGLWDRIINKD